MSLKENIKWNLGHFLGKRTSTKKIIIQSDDWGTIRMPSRKAYDRLISKGVSVDKNAFSKYDALESNEDLEALFEVFRKYKGANGAHPVMAANVIVANPDFKKIKDDNFQKYHYEYFTETLKRYPKHDNVWELYKEGEKEGFFIPHFHGREHLNVTQYLDALQSKDDVLLKAFEEETFAVNINTDTAKRNNLMAALDYETVEGYKDINNIILDGLQIFESIFNKTSDSFIAPCYIWSEKSEQVFAESGVKKIQSIPYQYEPTPNAKWYKKKFHYTGQQNQFGQSYLVRNVFFEPTVRPNKDWVGEALKRIDIAFKWKKPVILSTHRINFIGSIHPENRTKNLKLLDELLRKIIQNWPDVHFVDSQEL